MVSSDAEESLLDVCSWFGLYGNGHCNPLCWHPDPDCYAYQPPPPPPPPPVICGGYAGVECGPNAYCVFPSDGRCGAPDEYGVCRPRPQACSPQVATVCGCDGVSYRNACEAIRSGANYRADGPCVVKGPSCVGACGTATHDCWCDPNCRQNGDCCPDADAVCGI